MTKVIRKARRWWYRTPDGRIAEVFIGGGAALTLVAALGWMALSR